MSSSTFGAYCRQGKNNLLLSAVSDADDPVSVEEALSSAEASAWKRAMEEEIDSLKSNNTWVLTNLPAGKEL